jgi:hypothetical protein
VQPEVSQGDSGDRRQSMPFDGLGWIELGAACGKPFTLGVWIRPDLPKTGRVS